MRGRQVLDLLSPVQRQLTKQDMLSAFCGLHTQERHIRIEIRRIIGAGPVAFCSSTIEEAPDAIEAFATLLLSAGETGSNQFTGTRIGLRSILSFQRHESVLTEPPDGVGFVIRMV